MDAIDLVRVIINLLIVIPSGQHYLGYNNYDLKGVSYYNLLHPDSTKEVQTKHRLSKCSKSPVI